MKNAWKILGATLVVLCLVGCQPTLVEGGQKLPETKLTDANPETVDTAVTTVRLPEETDGLDVEIPEGGYEVDGDPDEGGAVDGPLAGTNWGRVMNGAISAGKGNGTINNRYSCLHFDYGNLLFFEWHYEGQRFTAVGTYSVEPAAEPIVRWELTAITEPAGYKGPQEKYLGHYQARITEKPGKRREIRYEHTIEVYIEGIQWDFDKGYYVDENGQDIRVNRQDASPKRYVGHDGGGWQIEDYIASKKMISVFISDGPVEQQKKEARKWLESKGIEEGTYTILFNVPGYLSGQGGP